MCRVSILFCLECGLASQIFRKNILKSASYNFPTVKLILKFSSVPVPFYIQFDMFTKLAAYFGCCGHLPRAAKKKKKYVFIVL